MEEFQKLYEKNYKKVYFYLLQLTKNEKLSEDLTQDTFYNTLVYLCNSKRAEVTGSWFLKIAHNRFIDHVRKNKQDIGYLELADCSLEQEEPDRAFALDFHAVLALLPVRYRSLLLLRDHYGFSYPEIAEIMGCTQSTVKVALHRARERFKEVYDQYGRQSKG